MNADVNNINEDLVNKLIKKKLKISTAESCTGGLLAALITQIAGASDIFEESIVTYSNTAKMHELNVNKETLDKYGAVSENTAYEMCVGICEHTGADIGIGVTGIAGPGGGSDKKPVGTVFIGICVLGKVNVLNMHFDGDRDNVRTKTAYTAFKKALDMIDEI